MKKLTIISVLFLLSAISVFAQNRSTICVSGDSTVENDVVRLGNIAQISGEPGKIERLKMVSLGYAPNLGARREISRQQIALAISAAGFSEGEVVLDAPVKVLIRRAGQIISQDQIRELVEKSLTDKFFGDKISAQILRIDLPDGLQVPKGTVEIRPNFSAVQNFFQPFSVSVEIRIDGKVIRRLSVNVAIEAFAEVLVATKDLAANLKITESDARFEKRRIVKPITNYLRETQSLRGLRLIKAIAGGAEITSDCFISGVVINNGDPVRVEAQSGKLRIIISGEARASGKIGDRIAVKNLQSGSILQAVVIDEGLVRVIF